MYDMKALKAEVDQEKKKKNQSRVQRCRQNQMSQDIDKYNQKRAFERQNERAEKMKIDPDGFRQTESTGRQKRRTQEISKNPEQYSQK